MRGGTTPSGPPSQGSSWAALVSRVRATPATDARTVQGAGQDGNDRRTGPEAVISGAGSEWAQVKAQHATNQLHGPHGGTSTHAAGSSRSGTATATAAAGPSSAPPARSSLEALLAQAKRSTLDPVSGKVRCRACGQAFPSYTRLAQHLGSKHEGEAAG